MSSIYESNIYFLHSVFWGPKKVLKNTFYFMSPEGGGQGEFNICQLFFRMLPLLQPTLRVLTQLWLSG